MTTETVSADEVESTRKIAARNEGEVLRAVARVTQAHAATCMGVSASTISRTLEDLPRWSQLLASVGLQLAPIDAMVVDRAKLEALEEIALQYFETRKMQRMMGQR
ncbi:MarR family transcriptional regulator [Cupriavidus pauculus]|uniref:CII family transcriptional regulator n=1 Tax=Cupriavidus pauculus TaxID=82633 RepID=UPI001C93276A|nr:CII family transcriptional regulator [Cupriavidus pauculus]MBY4730765.1 MarR family transcriptional regulator [Cupriavidus pauculus]